MLRNSPAAAVTVVAPAIRPEIRALTLAHPRLQLRERPYSVTDLVGHDLVMIATNDKELNRHIKADATRQRLLANVADTPAECDFYLGAIVQKGDLKIAISTNGKSPTVAKRLREVLTDALPAELHDLLQQMAVIRDRLKGDFAYKVQTLNTVTAGLAADPTYEPPAVVKWRRLAVAALVALGAATTLHSRHRLLHPATGVGLSWTNAARVLQVHSDWLRGAAD